MADTKTFERQSEKPMVRTSGRVFPDGSIMELIRIPNGELNFLIWNGKSANTAKQFVGPGEIFAPLSVDPSILPWLQFPSKTTEFGSTRKLFTEISGLISRTQVNDGVAKALSFFVFATWLDDYLPAAPFLWIVAPPTAAIEPLLALPPRFGLERRLCGSISFSPGGPAANTDFGSRPANSPGAKLLAHIEKAPRVNCSRRQGSRCIRRKDCFRA